MRCLTLANALRDKGAECTFVCRPHAGHLLDLIAKRGHKALVLSEPQANFNAPADPAHSLWLGTSWADDVEQTKRALGEQTLDWLVVDHYALGACWEQALRPQAKRIMVIDDLADRPHSCDLLLDQNWGREEADYSDLLKGKTTTLIGPRYALLSPEFPVLRSQSLARRQNTPQLRSLLINMGGVDKENVTGQVLAALKSCTLPVDLRVTVVMGPYAPWLAQVQTKAEKIPWSTEVLVGVNNMAQLMAESDLSIGAAGSTAWERCCLGVPTIQVALARNQEAIAQALSQAGAALVLRRKAIAQELPGLVGALASSEKRYAVSLAASSLTEGNGALLLCDLMTTNNENHAPVQ
jgi:UDP-2,4-diacetamido-2,4,6-trideoxy-beta-L-altropyranose hydrolase